MKEKEEGEEEEGGRGGGGERGGEKERGEGEEEENIHGKKKKGKKEKKRKRQSTISNSDKCLRKIKQGKKKKQGVFFRESSQKRSKKLTFQMILRSELWEDLEDEHSKENQDQSWTDLSLLKVEERQRRG
jgi:hypothetical protein